MGYLEDVLKMSAQTQSRSKKRKSSISDLLYAVAPSVQAATPAPGATAQGGPHSMGDGHGHKSQGTVNGLNAEFNANLQRLIKDSGGQISVGSGYRSYDQQAKLYQRWVNRVPGQAPAAKPGESKHNYGTAADLVFKNGGRAFAHANAEKYGLFFPMSYEPWHIEPVSNKSKYKKYRK